MNLQDQLLAEEAHIQHLSVRAINLRVSSHCISYYEKKTSLVS